MSKTTPPHTTPIVRDHVLNKDNGFSENMSSYDPSNVRSKVEKIEALLPKRRTVYLKPGMSMAIYRDKNNTSDDYETIKNLLLDFYDDFKKYFLMDEVEESLKKILQEDTEEDPVLLIKYMTHTIKTLYRIRMEEKEASMSFKVVSQATKEQDYELLLQKAESDLRHQIRNMQQMKLVNETLQMKNQEIEKNRKEIVDNTKSLLKEVKADNAKLLEILKSKDSDLATLERRLKQKSEVIKSYEDRLLTVTILEQKLQGLKAKHNKEKQDMKDYYEGEFNNLNKEVQHIHHILSVNLNNDEKIKYLQKELSMYKEYNIKKIRSIEEKIKGIKSFEEKGFTDDEEGPAGGDSKKSGSKNKMKNFFMKVGHKGQMIHGKSEHSIPGKSDQTHLFSFETTPVPSHRPQFSSTSGLQKLKPTKRDKYHSKEKRGGKTEQQREFFEKKKKEITEEITNLSLRRIKELDVARKSEGTSPKSLNFDHYFDYLAKTLDKLSSMNDQEKEQLRHVEKIVSKSQVLKTNETNHTSKEDSLYYQKKQLLDMGGVSNGAAMLQTLQTSDRTQFDVGPRMGTAQPSNKVPFFSRKLSQTLKK